MPEQDDQAPSVRRVGAKDRKRQLDKPAPLADDADLPEDLAVLAAEVVQLEPLPPPEQQRDTAERFPPINPVDDTPQQQPAAGRLAAVAPHQGGDWRHNILALLFMLGTVGLCGAFAIIWNNPQSNLNPLPPATPFVKVSETPDVVAIAAYQAELTRTASQPTIIPTVGASPTPLPQATFTPPPTVTAPQVTFTLSDEGVQYRNNTNGRGCNWASIAGEVETITGRGLDGYLLRVTDFDEPDLLNIEFLSGSAPERGPGGFEQRLGSSPRERQYTIQIFDEDRNPLSEPFLIFTRDSCDENVALVTFVQVDS
jgi:hypothetical protein